MTTFERRLKSAKAKCNKTPGLLTNVPMEFGERLAWLMDARGLTCYALAKLAGLPEETVSRFVEGSRLPSFRCLLATCMGLKAKLGIFDGVTCDRHGK